MRNFFAALLTLGLALPAAAQGNLTDEQKAAIRSKCSSDMRSYCQSHISGDASLKSAMKACMQEHFQDFSRQCKITLIRTRMKAN